MSAPIDLESGSRLLIDLLVSRGSVSSNKALREALRWPEERYWEIRNYAVSKGDLVLGKGKGGSVRIPDKVEAPDVFEEVEVEPVSASRIVPAEDVKAEPTDEAKVREYTLEAHLYEPIIEVLQDQWAKDQVLGEDFLVENTAQQGRRSTGGRWTRPDITVVSVRTYEFLPTKYLDIWTFEIKRTLDPIAVFEASAHCRFATRAFAMLPYDDTQAEILERILEDCRRLNIGLITFNGNHPDNYDEWEMRWDPLRREPDPDEVMQFMSQLSQRSLDRIRRWCR